jgi:hypothetical protein
MNTKLSRIKATLKSVLAQFQAERVTSDKGILDIQKAGEEIATGDTVMLVDEEGNETQVENGEYILTDGRVLVVEDGKITEIRDKEEEVEETPAEETPEREGFMRQKSEFEESYDEKTRKIADAIRSLGFDAWVVEAADDYAVVEVWADGGVKHYRFAIAWDEEGNPVVGEMTEVEQEYVPVEEETVVEPAVEEVVEEAQTEETFEEVENPTNEGEESDTEAVVKLREEVNELYKIVDELKTRLDAVEKKPAAESATEEFAKVNKVYKTGDEKLDRLAKIMGA